MIKYKEYTDKNTGAVIVYQYNPNQKGYQVTWGFRGDFLDGIPGVKHLVEHLLFKGRTIEETNKLTESVLRNTAGLSAATTENSIYVAYTALGKCLDRFTDLMATRFNNRKFTLEQIRNELKVIKNELDYAKGSFSEKGTLLGELLLWPQDGVEEAKVMGTYDDLKKRVTPEFIADYMEKYFNTNNLVISVSTEDSFENVKKYFTEHVISKFKPAQYEEYIALPPVKKIYSSNNLLLAYPNPYASNVSVSLFLRERFFPVENKELDAALKIYEENIFNDIGGILFNRLRTRKPLVYTYGAAPIETGTTCFQSISAMTSKKNLNEVINVLCQIAKEFGEVGVEKKYFTATKKALIELEDVAMKVKLPNSTMNFQNFISEEQYLDQEKVEEYLKTIKFEEFNQYIINKYMTKNASLIVSGDFDSRQIPNLIEIEEKLGKTQNTALKPQLNLPRKETVPATLTPEEIYNLTYQQSQIGLLNAIDEQTLKHSKKKKTDDEYGAVNADYAGDDEYEGDDEYDE